MDIDDMKGKTMRVKAPATTAKTDVHGDDPAKSLLDILKATDEQHLQKTQRARRLFAIATGIFLLAFVVTLLDPSNDQRTHERQMLYGSIALVYIFVFIVYTIGVRKLSRVDHSVSVRRFLEQAELRYRFMRPSDWVLALAGLVVVIVVTTVGYVPYLSRIFGDGGNATLFNILVPAFLAVVAVLGMFFAWKNWQRDRAPLWRQIREMQRQL